MVLILFFTSLTIYSQNEEKLYEDKKIKSIYHQTQGRFNGNYISYYRNGKKKAEGIFENNLRIGKWTVWDSIGNVRMVRVYSDPFTFERLTPKVPNDKPIQLLNIPRYNIQYNTESFITYAYVKESDVYYHKRIWRFISPENNSILFEEKKLFKLLNHQILDSNIKAYDPSDDEFTKEFIPIINTPTIKLIGFKIKEDFFFDMNRVISETRIMGVCPVVINLDTKDTIDFYWVYYPWVRKYLSQNKIEEKSIPTKIKTLDDLFFYRFFCGEIYKESHVYDRGLPDHLNSEKSERVEINLIEKEHDIWINLTKPPNTSE
ncbi:MAG: hypothetical protein HRT73_05795, partial [Flavobacteriales bacterium]|nr:hypothetical protein [Flavobacteriales bacterium]